MLNEKNEQLRCTDAYIHTTLTVQFLVMLRCSCRRMQLEFKMEILCNLIRSAISLVSTFPRYCSSISLAPLLAVLVALLWLMTFRLPLAYLVYALLRPTAPLSYTRNLPNVSPRETAESQCRFVEQSVNKFQPILARSFDTSISNSST